MEPPLAETQHQSVTRTKDPKIEMKIMKIIKNQNKRTKSRGQLRSEIHQGGKKTRITHGGGNY